MFKVNTKQKRGPKKMCCNLIKTVTALALSVNLLNFTIWWFGFVCELKESQTLWMSLYILYQNY